MLMNIGLATVYRTLVEKENMFGKNGESFYMLSSPVRSVILGSRNLSCDTLGFCGPVHRALKITENHPFLDPGLWTEVQGKFDNSGFLVLDSGSPELPVGVSEMGVQSMTGTIPVKYLGPTGRSNIEIEIFKRTFVKNNPAYGAFSNCITYVEALGKFLGVEM